MINLPKKLGDYHLFLDLWLTPWSWCKPYAKRYKYGEFVVCFGFGKLELLCD